MHVNWSTKWIQKLLEWHQNFSYSYESKSSLVHFADQPMLLITQQRQAGQEAGLNTEGIKTAVILAVTKI